jgi:hypothetical protein
LTLAHFFKEQLQALEVLTGSYSCGTKEWTLAPVLASFCPPVLYPSRTTWHRCSLVYQILPACHIFHLSMVATSVCGGYAPSL